MKSASSRTKPKGKAAAPKLVRPIPTLALETLLVDSSGGPVCGVDEAGRGPWAGPVSAAAVILHPDDLPEGIDDSKVLTAERREALEIEIKARAVEALSVQPVAALVDGNYRFRLPCEVQTVVGGDGLSLSIAAASILAKTARDRLMIELDALYPGYGFASHKGYNAPAHQRALRELGPCPEHRRAWAPIKALLEG